MKNILCIDDIATNLFTLESVLKSKKANLYNVLTAQSAHGGLDILLRKKVDLILLDVMMPDVDGFACAKMIRGNKKTKDIPIIFVTAKTDDATIERCYEVGGDDYVSKPFNSIELLARVSFHLSLKDKARLLSREKEYAQSVIDIQDNFIIVTDANQALNVNQSLLDFFGLNSLFEFQRKIHCVCQTFIKEEGYFYLELVEDSFDWVEYVINLLKTGDVLVKMKDKLHQEHTFAIKAKSFYDVYIVSLTDITIISEKSDEYKREANFDELTQIYNRNMLHRLMDKKIHNQKEESRAFVFMILDIDFFKKVNDNYGHLVGDEILKGVTALIKNIFVQVIFLQDGVGKSLS